MKYKIISATKSGEFDGQHGKVFKYLLVLEDDQGQTKAATLNQKPETPVPSGEIEGTIEESAYGPQFKKAQTFSGGKFNDPNTRKEIIRQNSLTNAVNYVLGKAQHMDKKDALAFITGKEVLQVAIYFAKYSEGLVTVVTESKKPASDEIDGKDEPIRIDDDEQEEIDLSDIPFGDKDEQN